MDTITLVIPVYNQQATIAEAVESVLAQTDPVRLIVVDDGSTDGTPDILRHYATQCTILTQTNQGQSAALNRGWHLATTPWVSYLSGDDRLVPTWAATMRESIQPGMVLAYPDFHLLTSDGQVSRTLRPHATRHALVQQLRCGIGPGVLIQRATLMHHLGGWDPQYRLLPDLECWRRLVRQGALVHVPHVLAEFRVSPTSQSRKPPTFEMAEEPIRMTATDVPPIQAQGHLLAAQLHGRAGRWACVWVHAKAAFALHAAGCLSLYTLRMAVNAWRVG